MEKTRFLDRTTPPHIGTLVVIVAMASIPTNMFLASLPDMAVYFQTSYAVAQLSLTVFLGLTGIVQVFIGPLSDRYGRRAIMLWSMSIFIIASAASTLTDSFELFMVWRCIQASSVTGFVIARATVRDIAPREKAASLIGYVTMGMAVAPMVAPAIGGFLSEAYGWQSNFHVMSVLGLMVLLLIFLDQGETNRSQFTSFSAQFKTMPILLKSYRFWGYSLTNVFAAGCFFAYLGGAPYVGAVFYDLSPSELGLYLFFTPMGYMIGNGISGRFAAQLGMARMITIGPLITFFLLLMPLVFLMFGITDPLAFFAFTFGIGLGNGVTLPSASAGLLDIRPDLAGSAAGLSGAMTTFGGAGLSTLAGLLLSPETGPYPLIFCILGSSLISWVIAQATLMREKQVRKDPL